MHPVYIVTKGRSQLTYTMKALNHMGVPFYAVVEHQEAADYADPVAAYGGQLLVLDPQFQRDYDACMELGPNDSRGPGPARNFAWEHSISLGHSHHWVMDDNIRAFYILEKNARLYVGDATPFIAMEDFCSRYVGIAMAGPNYAMFVPDRQRKAPYSLNTRIYSCNYITNNVSFRWRGRYNEDTDLSLRMLKAGFNTVQFNVFLQDKLPTQKVAGGNTEEFYKKEGTVRKSMMLVQMHPDVTRPVMRFGREHHYVDYTGFKQPLRRRPDAEIPTAPRYRFRQQRREKTP